MRLFEVLRMGLSLWRLFIILNYLTPFIMCIKYARMNTYSFIYSMIAFMRSIGKFFYYWGST